MIAYQRYTAKVYYSTDDASSNVGYETDDTSSTTVYIVSDGWQEVSNEAFIWNETKIKEPAQEQDEPSTGERPVIWKRPNRRLATVTGLRRVPQQKASTYG